jgi:hypothetical protein
MHRPSDKITPIAIFAYRRLDLLQATLSALEAASGFSSHPLVVFSDAASVAGTSEALEVAEVRRWLRDWCALRGAELHEAKESLGLRRSIVSGVSRILETHERIIVLEDDMIVSPSFLQFMNDALDALSERSDVMQISGYFVPHKRSLPPAGLLRAPGSWGWATWRRAWKNYVDDAEYLLRCVRESDPDRFDFNGAYAFVDALQRNVDGTLNSWLVRWYASMYLCGGLAVYPGKSLVRNIGFGPRATNTLPEPTAKTHLTQPVADTYPPIDWTGIGQSESFAFADTVEGFYRWQHHEWVKPSWGERIRARVNLLLKGQLSG